MKQTDDSTHPLEIEIHSDSLTLGLASIEVIMRANEILNAIGKRLRWTRRAIDALIQIAIRIGDSTEDVPFPSKDLGGLLMPDKGDASAKRKTARYIETLIACQAETGFLAVYIKRGHMKGEAYVPTSYKVNLLHQVIARVQALVMERDALRPDSKRERDRQMSLIYSQVIHEFRFQPRALVQAHKAQKKKEKAEAMGEGEENRYRANWQEQAERVLDLLDTEVQTLFDDAEDYGPAAWFAERIERCIQMQLERKRQSIKTYNLKGAEYVN